MTLWVILTIMTSAAAVWLSAPLIRRFERARDETASDVNVYRDQLAEVERELRQGMIDDGQAESARIEIKRRILATDRSRPEVMPGLSGTERSFALVGAAGIVVLGSVILYAVTGSPDLPSASRLPDAGRLTTPQPAFPPQHPPLEGLASADRARPSDSESGSSSQSGLPTVEEMIRRLAVRLARNPADTEGWRTLGWSYLNIGRFSEAADAYAKAIELDPGNAEFRGGRIEALVGGADGTVTAEAKAAIRETLERDPNDVRARYFDGLAREQEGDKAAALAQWTELLQQLGSGGESDQSWASELRNKVGALKRDMGLDGVAEADGRKPAGGGGSPEISRAPTALETPRETPRPVERGPGPQDVQAAEAMLPADRSTMIRGMVDGLAGRLERSPRDADGWIKLIRSRVVLGESELAKQALARGLAVFADEAPERDRIAAAARELGINP